MKRIGRKIELNAINIFLLVSISGIVLFFLIAPFLRQRSLEWLVMENNPHYIVLDFQLAELWGQHFGNAYEKSEIIYPPMALLAFKYISRITTSFDLSCDKCDVIHYPYQLMVLLLYVSLPVIWLYRCFQNTGLNRSKLSQLMFCIVCSVPMFAGGIEKSNIILYVIPMIFSAFLLKDSDNKVKREAALLLIALAASIKVFPAIMGLIYVKEKRWRESFRLLIYGAALFFLPFSFFGGLSGIKCYFHNSVMRNEYYAKRYEYFKGLLAFANIQGIKLKILSFAFAVALIALLMMTKDIFREKVYFASFLAFVPNCMYRYMLLLFLIPLFYLIKEDENKNIDLKDKINAFILASIFSIPTVWGLLTGFRLNFGLFSCTYVELYIYIFAWTLLIYQIVLDLKALIEYIQKERI